MTLHHVVARLLFLSATRVWQYTQPVVAFLTTRVTILGKDNSEKSSRLLGYLKGSYFTCPCSSLCKHIIIEHSCVSGLAVYTVHHDCKWSTCARISLVGKEWLSAILGTKRSIQIAWQKLARLELITHQVHSYGSVFHATRARIWVGHFIVISKYHEHNTSWDKWELNISKWKQHIPVKYFCQWHIAQQSRYFEGHQ